MTKDTYQKGDALRKQILKEYKQLERKLRHQPCGAMATTDRIWVRKKYENCYDWGCR